MNEDQFDFDKLFDETINNKTKFKKDEMEDTARLFYNYGIMDYQSKYMKFVLKQMIWAMSLLSIWAKRNNEKIDIIPELSQIQIEFEQRLEDYARS